MEFDQLESPEVESQAILELQARGDAATQAQPSAAAGSITPITAGGTGSTTAAGARANLGAAPYDATYITQTANAELTSEQALGALATGILKNTTTTGVLSIATITDINALLAVAWASWTPTWTNLSVGNGTVAAKYVQVGKSVYARLSIVFGTTTTISGEVSFTLPVTSVAYPGTATTAPIGNGTAYDSGVAQYDMRISWASATTALCRIFDTSGTYSVQAAISSTVPFVWENLDELNGQFFYEVA